MAHLAKRTKVFSPEGERVTAEPELPWASAAKSALAATSARDIGMQGGETEGGEGKVADVDVADIDQKAAQSLDRMFKRLIAARSELEVVLDVLGELGRGESFAIGGLQRQRTAASRTNQAAEHYVRRRRRLMRVTEMFQSTKSLLAKKVKDSEVFYRDLTRLQRNWKVKRSGKNEETGFCFDLSHPLLLHQESKEVEICTSASGNLCIKLRGQRAGGVMGGGVEKVNACLLEETTAEFHRSLSGQVLSGPGTAPGRRFTLHSQNLELLWNVLSSTLPNLASASHTERGAYLALQSAYLEASSRGAILQQLIATLGRLASHRRKVEVVLQALEGCRARLPQEGGIRYIHVLDSGEADVFACQVVLSSGEALIVMMQGDDIKLEGPKLYDHQISTLSALYGFTTRGGTLLVDQLIEKVIK